MTSAIEIYQATNGSTQIKVKLEHDTVWLTQSQMQELFQKSKATISEHIKNIFTEGELIQDRVVRKSRTTTQHGAIPGKTQESRVNLYNLDVIISVGYRVKSKRGTQFRIWANGVLKEYLIQGYAINKKRLEEKQQEIQILKTGIRILGRAVASTSEKEATDEMLKLFSKGLELLDDYDHEALDKKGNTKKDVVYPTKDEYLEMVAEMYSDFESDVFAKPKDESFDSSIHQIQQVFGGIELYPTLEVKAANLLYLIVKNHSFVDGNKRIAAACFLYFLDKNHHLVIDGTPILSNEALATLTLFIATSKSDESEIVIRLIISILNRWE